MVQNVKLQIEPQTRDWQHYVIYGNSFVFRNNTSNNSKYFNNYTCINIHTIFFIQTYRHNHKNKISIEKQNSMFTSIVFLQQFVNP